jgi:hypothetical protein
VNKAIFWMTKSSPKEASRELLSKTPGDGDEAQIRLYTVR